jgi:hypothetical protein
MADYIPSGNTFSTSIHTRSLITWISRYTNNLIVAKILEIRYIVYGIELILFQ